MMAILSETTPKELLALFIRTSESRIFSCGINAVHPPVRVHASMHGTDDDNRFIQLYTCMISEHTQIYPYHWCIYCAASGSASLFLYPHMRVSLIYQFPRMIGEYAYPLHPWHIVLRVVRFKGLFSRKTVDHIMQFVSSRSKKKKHTHKMRHNGISLGHDATAMDVGVFNI